ncbi:beta-ketoacyl-[acyl-carrier-protein] synthase family protein [Saccharothrix deserti]|uniref:beta-ketoacyl-[acyl-carrier-protein] synthase family protein n=1 Tax=Saccharothrix deserti TaxID=2593674 RepID=UPI001EE3C6E6|nr:beta-ketoacyl-[acyl-carrier-protein] synthase family protein [Saccharothrix deserti]
MNARNAPQPVAITGLGMITPAGADTAATWREVCRGTATAAVDPALADLPVSLSCRVRAPLERPVMRRKGVKNLDPVTRFALNAADEALDDSGLDPIGWQPDRVAVVTGTGAGGSHTVTRGHEVLAAEGPRAVSPYHLPASLINMTSAFLSLYFTARGPSFTVSTACASGADALGLAQDLLAADRCDIALVCGAEAGITPISVASFAQIKALSAESDPRLASRPFDRDRNGFVIAEGACVLVLERPRDAAARGARIRALLLGHASTNDAHHATAPHPDGLGAETALRQAIHRAGLTAADITHVNAHGTSTPANDRIEACLLTQVLPHHPVVTSSKGALGHALGAAGTIEAALTVLALEEHRVPPTAGTRDLDPECGIDLVLGTPRAHPGNYAVSNSFGFGGHNSVVVLAAP